MASDRKEYQKDPPYDSWAWEMAHRAVAAVLRRVRWRIGHPVTDEIESIGRQSKNDASGEGSA